MKQVSFYRIEQRTSRKGPYHTRSSSPYHVFVAGHLSVETGHSLYHSNLCPEPSTDDLSLLTHPESHTLRFGFVSLDQLKAWFQPTQVTVDILQAEDMILSRYDVPEDQLMTGQKQAVAPAPFMAGHTILPLESILPDTGHRAHEVSV